MSMKVSMSPKSKMISQSRVKIFISTGGEKREACEIFPPEVVTKRRCVSDDHEKPEIAKEEIVHLESKLASVIGSGASAFVYRTVFKTKEVAVKVFRATSSNYYYNETNTFIKLQRHVNLVEYISHGTYESIGKYIIMEYCEKGSLFDLIHTSSISTRNKNSKKTVDVGIDANKFNIAEGIIKGLNHIHQMGIVHTDLSSRNILIDSNYTPKICDFGLSVMETDFNENVYNRIGSVWKAPELYKKNRKLYKLTNKCDLFSYSMIIWELLNPTHFPFEDELQPHLLILQGIRPPLSDSYPKWSHIVRTCWEQDPKSRPNTSEVLKYIENYPSEQ